MSSLRISVVAISKNEQADLPAFLENVLPWAFEVIIVDDGSTDQTESIAMRAGSKVKFIKHPMDEQEGFAGQRNVGLAASSGDWLLNMDIDERLSYALYLEMVEAASNTKLNGFRYRRANFFLHRQMKAGGWTSWNQPQFARRGSHKFVNRIHERASIEGEPASVGQLKNKMWHLNDDSYSERLRKSVQYCHIEADKLIKAKRKIGRLDLIVGPLKEFAKKFIYQRAYKDGTAGLISAMHSAGAIFRTYALCWDRQNHISRSSLENMIQEEWKDFSFSDHDQHSHTKLQ